MVDAAQEADCDRRCCTEDDHEEDRALAELEEKDREREPRDRGHGLQAQDGVPHRFADDGHPRHEQPDCAADHHRDRVPGQRPPHRDRDARVEVGLAQVLCQALKDRERTREDVVGFPTRPHHHLPDAKTQRDCGQQRRVVRQVQQRGDQHGRAGHADHRDGPCAQPIGDPAADERAGDGAAAVDAERQRGACR